MNLSRRTNEYFTKFVGNWLKSDSIARHFVFELGGFEFLLDTIGKKEQVKEESSGSFAQVEDDKKVSQIDSKGP
jgi:hypothetical protein